MESFIDYWLQKTAWPMDPPLPFSPFHLCFVFFGIPFSIYAAWRLRRLQNTGIILLLHILGICLAVSELYKQLFLYFINNHAYDWWYFPFQLCSIPMYLCLLLPAFQKRGQCILCTFMYTYNLPGAFLVFLDPSGMMHPFWTLTLHSFLWHLILIFIGTECAFSGMVSTCFRDFAGSTGLFLICCAIATSINVLAHPLGNPDMFYISPYFPTTQLIFSDIAARFGIPAGNLCYLAAIIAGAALLFVLHRHISLHKTTI